MNVIWSVIFRVHKWTFVGTWPHLSFMHYSGFLNIRAELRRRQWKIWHPTTGKAGFRTPVGVHPRRKKRPAWVYTIMSVLFEKVFFVFGHAEPMWNHSSPTRETTTGPSGKSLRVFFFSFLLRLCTLENAFPISESVYPQLHTMIEINRVGCAAWLSGRESPAWATLGCWVNEMIH